jgi:hypothetical protein
VRGKIVENVVTADYFTATPTFAGSGAATQTATLSAANEIPFGRAVPGRIGFTWLPADTAATVDDLTSDKMMVWRGQFQNMCVIEGTGLTAGYMIYGAFTNRIRPDGKIVFRDCDVRGFTAGTGITDLRLADSPDAGATLKPALYRINNDYYTNPGPTSPAVGASPYTYQNLDMYAERAAVYGGTVSNISHSRDGVTFTQVSAATEFQMVLEPGDYLRVTYSAAPTLTVVPLL